MFGAADTAIPSVHSREITYCGDHEQRTADDEDHGRGREQQRNRPQQQGERPIRKPDQAGTWPVLSPVLGHPHRARHLGTLTPIQSQNASTVP